MSKSDKRLHALLVDDNLLVLKSLGMIFDVLGWSSVQVEDSEQALRQLEKQQFDLVILDLRMPETDGISLCRTIRENVRYKDIIIFIHSGYMNDQTLAEAERAGANAVLHKPMGLNEIRSQLKSVGLEK